VLNIPPPRGPQNGKIKRPPGPNPIGRRMNIHGELFALPTDRSASSTRNLVPWNEAKKTSHSATRPSQSAAGGTSKT
jgi:hypothetical protein